MEPSCGQGIFLLRIISKVYDINPSKNGIDNLIAETLIFNDIDLTMVEKTIENIKNLYFYLFEEEYCGKFQAFTSDFTLRNSSENSSLFSNVKNEIILSEYYNSIDYIVGNPPYI